MLLWNLQRRLFKKIRIVIVNQVRVLALVNVIPTPDARSKTTSRKSAKALKVKGLSKTYKKKL